MQSDMLVPSILAPLDPFAMSTDETALRRRSEDLHAKYRYGFAGKPRLTRRLADLESILQTAKALLDQAKEMVGEGEVTEEMRTRLQLYMTERDAIVEAQAAGPNARMVSMLGTRANALFAVYTRHFAGKSRLTRDVALLDDLTGAIEEVRSELRELVSTDAAAAASEQLVPIEKNLEMYASERANIVATQQGTGEERTTAFANIANAQFDTYRKHFAGKSRLSRRTGLIDRVVSSLEKCEAGMQALIAEGEQLDTNRANLAIVQSRLADYRAEATAIRAARGNASVFEIIDALGQDANLVMEEYATHFAGKDRGTRNLDQLGTLMDRLAETERQMWTLSRVQDNPTNSQNITIVHDTALVYEHEYKQIRDAQSH